MRLLPQVSQPTLDSFRKDVYRPRLALLLLVLLLHDGKHMQPAPSPGLDVSTSGPSSIPLVLPQSSAWDHVKTYYKQIDSRFNSLHRYTFSKGKRRTRKESKMGRGSRKRPKSVPLIAQKSERRAASINLTPTLQSVIELPRVLFEYIFQRNILSAIIPLHILWIIRLGGMMIEDTIVKSSAHAKDSRAGIGSSQGAVLIKVAALAVLAVSVLLISDNSIFNAALSVIDHGTVTGSSPAKSVMPIRFILLLELSATLLSLLCPLMKLNNSNALSRLLPTRVQLPSPSHSPPLFELLPLPPGLADIISGHTSDSQSRPNRRNPARRPGAASMVLAPARQNVAAQAATDDNDQRNPARWSGGMLDPLILPENASSTSGDTKKRAPRQKGVTVEVDTCWLLENLVIMWGAFVGAIEYFSVVLALPTLSPISFPPVVALLSLRSQLGALVFTWTSARRAVECLEFVRRRWVAYTPLDSTKNTRESPTSHRRWQPDAEDDVFCPICFELIRARSSSRKAEDDGTVAESCRLDCGHELHAVCLVQIFLGNKQAYCPCCHDPLRATPPNTQTVVSPRNR